MWASQKTSYAELYFAYECFVVKCLKLVSGNFSKKFSSANAISSGLNEHFGNLIKDECWQDDPVWIARLIRNAIVHHGARITDKLQEAGPRLKVRTLDDRLQIFPEDVRQLFHDLKQCAMKLGQASIQRMNNAHRNV